MGVRPAKGHSEFTESSPLQGEAQMRVVDKQGCTSLTVPWCPVKLTLHNRELGFSGDAVNFYLPINDRFEILRESCHQQCLMLSSFLQLQNFYCFLKFESVHAFLQWTQKLKEAKRPRWQNLSTPLCGLCSAHFTMVRRQHHCRTCGRAVCAACSPALAELPHLGYTGLQRVCVHCSTTLQHTTIPRLSRRRSLPSGIRATKEDLDRSASEIRKQSHASLQPY